MLYTDKTMDGNFVLTCVTPIEELNGFSKTLLLQVERALRGQQARKDLATFKLLTYKGLKLAFSTLPNPNANSQYA